MRKCRKCSTERPLEDYYLTPSGNPRWVCKICMIRYQKEVVPHQETFKNNRHGYVLKSRFNITKEDYDLLLEKQGGGCGICESKIPQQNRRYFSVDHDHSCCSTAGKSCGKCVRGLLCARCNWALGGLGDSIEMVEKALNYLKNTPSLEGQPLT